MIDPLELAHLRKVVTAAEEYKKACQALDDVYDEEGATLTTDQYDQLASNMDSALRRLNRVLEEE